MNKSSNLVIGQKFSGELGICLSSENWQLGDTVVTFENGKPDNANFYIWENNAVFEEIFSIRKALSDAIICKNSTRKEDYNEKSNSDRV